MGAPLNIPQLRKMINTLLDRGYESVAEDVIASIARATNSGVIAQRLKELQDEAKRLVGTNQALRPDNPVVRALLADLDDVLRKQAGVINNATGNVTQAGMDTADNLSKRLTLNFVPESVQGAITAEWNNPDPNALKAIHDYLSGPQLGSELRDFRVGSVDAIRQAAIRAFAEGKGPIAAARELRQLVEDMPRARANNLLRTMFNVAHREAHAAHQLANQHILQEQVRIASLDRRCCLSCINLHGKRYPLGMRIDDHHQGRCMGISVVRGYPLNIMSGEDWFNGLSAAEQEARMGPGRYADWKAGRFDFRDLSATYDDPLFKRMVRTATLTELRRQKPYLPYTIGY